MSKRGLRLGSVGVLVEIFSCKLSAGFDCMRNGRGSASEWEVIVHRAWQFPSSQKASKSAKITVFDKKGRSSKEETCSCCKLVQMNFTLL